jgi:hypothetical protein
MKPMSFRSINKEAMCLDKIPKKSIKKYKKKERQTAKREIKREVKQN